MKKAAFFRYVMLLIVSNVREKGNIKGLIETVSATPSATLENYNMVDMPR